MNISKLIHTGLNVIGLGLSAYASYEALSLSTIHLGGASVCPVLLGIPACIIVLICYVLITIAWGMAIVGKHNRQAMIVFSAGFLPAFLLALIGSTGEIFNFASCPHTDTGFPKCFMSFVFLIGLAIGWALSRYIKRRSASSS